MIVLFLILMVYYFILILIQNIIKRPYRNSFQELFNKKSFIGYSNYYT